MRLCGWAGVAGLTVAVIVGFAAPGVAEPPAGSKNFSSPGFVPNYFSNESGPVMQNPAPLPDQAIPAPVTAAPARQPSPAVAVERKAARHAVKAARSQDRHRTAHAKAGAANKRKVVSAKSGKSKAVRLAHAEPHGAKGKPTAAKAQRGGAAEKHAGRG